MGAGDLGIGPEGPVREPVDDAHVGQGGDGVVAPQVGAAVRVVVDLAPVLLPGVVRQQAEEDGGHFAPGDGAVGLQCAVGVADDIGVMVLRVQGGPAAASTAASGAAAAPAALLLVHQHEGREAAGSEDQMVAVAGSLDLFHSMRGTSQVTCVAGALTVHAGIVYQVERAVLVGVGGHGPVDGQRLLVAQGYHGVAVLGVHQVQIGHLVLGGG